MFSQFRSPCYGQPLVDYPHPAWVAHCLFTWRPTVDIHSFLYLCLRCGRLASFLSPTHRRLVLVLMMWPTQYVFVVVLQLTCQFGTSVGSGAISIKGALIIAAFMEFIGAVALGQAVRKWVIKLRDVGCPNHQVRHCWWDLLRGWHCWVDAGNDVHTRL